MGIRGFLVDTHYGRLARRRDGGHRRRPDRHRRRWAAGDVLLPRGLPARRLEARTLPTPVQEVPPHPPPQRPPDRQRGLRLPQRPRRGDAAQQAALLRLRGADRRLADPAADDPLQAAGRDAGRQRCRRLPLVSPHLPGDPPGDALQLQIPASDGPPRTGRRAAGRTGRRHRARCS